MNNDELEHVIKTLKNLKTQVIGRSWDSRNIYSVSTFFSGKNDWVIIQGAIHAREHLSADFIVYLIKVIDNNFMYYNNLENFPNICFVPILNPDGVEIVFNGYNAIKNIKIKENLQNILNSRDCNLYKSNARGVDLNNNFDAKFDFQDNTKKPSCNGYPGKFAFSEKETQSIRDLTIKVKPIFTISYHLKGEEIYYDFYQNEKDKKRDRKIAEIVSSVTGYKIKNVQDSSFGGYKDWCIEKLKIPALTIELASDDNLHPVKNVEIYDIISKNAGILDVLCDIVKLCKS